MEKKVKTRNSTDCSRHRRTLHTTRTHSRAFQKNVNIMWSEYSQYYSRLWSESCDTIFSRRRDAVRFCFQLRHIILYHYIFLHFYTYVAEIKSLASVAYITFVCVCYLWYKSIVEHTSYIIIIPHGGTTESSRDRGGKPFANYTARLYCTGLYI